MKFLFFIFLCFTCFTYFSYTHDNFQGRPFKEKFTIIWKTYKSFYIFLGFFSLLIFLLSDTIYNSPSIQKNTELIPLKHNPAKNTVNFNESDFFYLQMENDNKLHHHDLTYIYTQTESGKFFITLKNPVPKTDDISTQVFLGSLVVIFHENIPDYSSQSKIFEFVSLDTPKNQIPKPCCNKVIKTSIGHFFYYFSNISTSDDLNNDLATFVMWREDNLDY